MVLLFTSALKSQDTIPGKTILSNIKWSQIEVPAQMPPALNKQKPGVIRTFEHEKVPGWIFVILLIMLAGIAYIFSKERSFIQKQYKAFLNVKLSRLLYREDGFREGLSGTLLTALFITIIPLALAGAVSRTGWIQGYNVGELYLLFLLAIGFWLAVRYIVQLVVALLIRHEPLFRLVHFQTLIILRILGIGLIPLTILVFYGHGIIGLAGTWAIVIMCLSAIVLRFIRTFSITKDQFTLFPFHYFLYLCTLEFAPAAIVIFFIIKGI